MSDEFSDEFVIEEEGGSNRTFLIAAGSLLGLFIILAAVALATYFLQGSGDQEQGAEATSIAVANMTTEAQNKLTLLENEAIAADATAAAEEVEAPQATREPVEMPPTNTPEVDESTGATQPEAAATNTPVASEVEATTSAPAEATAEVSETPTLAPTAVADSTGSGAAGDSSTLPATGFGGWTLLFAAMGLAALLILARRARAA